MVIDAKPGEYARKVGLVWRNGSGPAVVSAESDVALNATDGTAVAGNVRGKAALWSSPTAAPTLLHPEKLFMSEVKALDGDVQAGSAWKGMRSRAAIWRGSAESFVDVTPKAFQVGIISASAVGYQVGSVRAKENTKNGTPGSDNRALLWQGAADRTFDLHALLEGTPYNASMAMAIEVEGDVVRICGQASRYEVDRAGTPHEQHVVPEAVPVVWTGRLSR